MPSCQHHTPPRHSEIGAALGVLCCPYFAGVVTVSMAAIDFLKVYGPQRGVGMETDAHPPHRRLRRLARQRARNDCFLVSCPEPGVRGRRQAPRLLRRLPPRRSRAAAISAPSDCRGPTPQMRPWAQPRVGGPEAKRSRSRSARRPVVRARHAAISTRGRGQTAAVACVPSWVSNFRKCETRQAVVPDLCVHG